MKINLITIHYSLSPGAVMQTYATCEILKELGHEVTIINFKDIVEKKRVKSIKYWLSSGITRVLFNGFRRKYYPKITKSFFALKFTELPKADYYLVGSDQVWNPYITEANVLSYMFDFLPDNVKRISYASSFGLDKYDFDVNFIQKVKLCLSKFNSISVREESGIKICKELLNIDAVQVLDPTMLIEDYSRLIGDNIVVRDELLCFKLVYNEDFVKAIKYMRSKLNLKTALLHTSSPDFNFDKNYYSHFDSPIRWLRRIASAKFVVTDSFHGLVFSLIFRKNFVVLAGSFEKITRIKSLLSLLGLQDRLFYRYEDLINNDYIIRQEIDYDLVSSIIEREKKKSIEYLNRALLS